MDRKIVTVKEAQERMKKVAAREVEAEEVSLMDAGGRILAEEIRAWQDNPPFPRSPYDGYAVRAKDMQLHAFLNVRNCFQKKSRES